MNDEAGYRTAPATPGLLISLKSFVDSEAKTVNPIKFQILYYNILFFLCLNFMFGSKVNLRSKNMFKLGLDISYAFFL